MAYKEMNYSIYFFATVSLYLGQILGAIFVSDIGLIFEFVSAIAVSNLAFIFPGMFYIMAENKFSTQFERSENKKVRCEAIFLVVIGIIAFAVQMTSNIIGIVNGVKGGH